MSIRIENSLALLIPIQFFLDGCPREVEQELQSLKKMGEK